MSLEEALAKIDKQFGKGAVQRLGDEAREPVDAISTGSIALDRALGIGGVPRGRIVEIYGPESSGKTTVALQIVANAQMGGVCAFIDTEHALDPIYAGNLGVDVGSLLVCQPETAEQALEIADELVQSRELTALVVDSVAALVTRAELEGDYGDSHVGLTARLMSQAMRKLTGSLSRYGTTAVFINQLRDIIGGFGYGPKETTTGGKALKFYSSARLDVRRIETEKQGDEATGNRTRVKVVKNKLAPPFRQCEFTIRYGEGISRELELLDLGVQYKVLKRSGAWYSFGDTQMAQGRENSRLWLSERPETASVIESEIREAMARGYEPHN